MPSSPTRIDLRIDDVDEARTFLDRTFGSRLLINRTDHASFALGLTMTNAGAFTASEAALPGQIAYRMLGQDDVIVNTLVAGAFEADHGTRVDRYVAGDTFIGNYGARTTAAGRTTSARGR